MNNNWLQKIHERYHKQFPSLTQVDVNNIIYDIFSFLDYDTRTPGPRCHGCEKFFETDGGCMDDCIKPIECGAKYLYEKNEEDIEKLVLHFSNILFNKNLTPCSDSAYTSFKAHISDVDDEMFESYKKVYDA